MWIAYLVDPLLDYRIFSYTRWGWAATCIDPKSGDICVVVWMGFLDISEKGYIFDTGIPPFKSPFPNSVVNYPKIHSVYQPLYTAPMAEKMLGCGSW